jgi:hypothetical protein
MIDRWAVGSGVITLAGGWLPIVWWIVPVAVLTGSAIALARRLSPIDETLRFCAVFSTTIAAVEVILIAWLDPNADLLLVQGMATWFIALVLSLVILVAVGGLARWVRPACDGHLRDKCT